MKSQQKNTSQKKKNNPGKQVSNQIQKAPVAISRVNKTQVPKYIPKKDGTIRVCHREYFDDVVGSDAFECTPYSINPGLSSIFPWLSGIANNYESYKFHKLQFEFETAASTQEGGRVLLAIDFDASDSTPLNKQALMSYKGAQSSAPWQDMRLTADQVDMKTLSQTKYVRNTVVSGTDIKTYDVGNLFVATQGCADDHELGEIYVSYDVELITPQTNVEIVASKVSSSSGTTPTKPFGTAPTLIGSIVASVSNGGDTIDFGRIGQYILEFQTSGFSVTALPSVSTNGNCAIQDEGGAFSSTSAQRSTTVNVYDLPASLVYSMGGFASSIASSALRGSLYPFSYS
jgi:hypothetical protein